MAGVYDKGPATSRAVARIAGGVVAPFVFVLFAVAPSALSLAKLSPIFVASTFLFEAILLWSYNGLRGSPRGLFFLGWTLPFFAAQAPLGHIVFNLEPINQFGYTIFFFVSSLFYVAEALVRSSPSQTLGGEGRAEHMHEVLNSAGKYAPYFWCVSTALIAILGFAVSLAHAGGIPPIWRDQVTQAAGRFWGVPGTATLFSLSRIFFLAFVIRLLADKLIKRRSIRTASDALLVCLAAMLTASMILYGKRAVLIYTFVPPLVLLLIFKRISRWTLIGVFVAASALFVGNAFLRARYGFEAYWAGRSFNAIPSAGWYSLIQPLLYARETFAQMSGVVSQSAAHGLIGASNAAGETLHGLRAKGKIVPLVGVLAASWGLIPALLGIFVVFLTYCLLFRLSRRGLWLWIYCLNAPGLVLLWTGVLAQNEMWIRMAALFLLWAFVVQLARSRRPPHAPFASFR